MRLTGKHTSIEVTKLQEELAEWKTTFEADTPSEAKLQVEESQQTIKGELLVKNIENTILTEVVEACDQLIEKFKGNYDLLIKFLTDRKYTIEFDEKMHSAVSDQYRDVQSITPPIDQYMNSKVDPNSLTEMKIEDIMRCAVWDSTTNSYKIQTNNISGALPVTVQSTLNSPTP